MRISFAALLIASLLQFGGNNTCPTLHSYKIYPSNSLVGQIQVISVLQIQGAHRRKSSILKRCLGLENMGLFLLYLMSFNYYASKSWRGRIERLCRVWALFNDLCHQKIYILKHKYICAHILQITHCNMLSCTISNFHGWYGSPLHYSDPIAERGLWAWTTFMSICPHHRRSSSSPAGLMWGLLVRVRGSPGSGSSSMSKSGLNVTLATEQLSCRWDWACGRLWDQSLGPGLDLGFGTTFCSDLVATRYLQSAEPSILLSRCHRQRPSFKENFWWSKYLNTFSSESIQNEWLRCQAALLQP